MARSEGDPRRVAVIGGGIAGMAAAYALQELARRQGIHVMFTMFEAAPHLGGKIVTEKIDGCVVEGGPDSFLAQKPWAAQLAQELMPEESKRTYQLRRKLQDYLFSHLDHLELNGHPTERLPGNLNVSFAYVEGEALMMAIKDVAVSSGSACTSASLEPSYVLRAMGVTDDLAHSSIRFGLGRFTTAEEIDWVTRLVVEKVKKLREMSPLYEMAKDGVDLSRIEWVNPH